MYIYYSGSIAGPLVPLAIILQHKCQLCRFGQWPDYSFRFRRSRAVHLQSEWGTFQSSGTFSNLDLATYTVAVQDANLCSVTVSVTISEPEQLSISGSETDASCPDVPDGSITLTITGGTQPYSVIWSDGILTRTARMFLMEHTVWWLLILTDVLHNCDVVVGVVGTEGCLEIPDYNNSE